MASFRWLIAGIVASLAVAIVAPVCAEPPLPDPAAYPRLRLPPGARPTRYEVTLTVVPGAPEASGEIAIDVLLDRPHPIVWLNAVALTVQGVSVDGAESHPRIISDNDQFVGLAFDAPLPPGPHRIVLRYEARQSRNSARGIFTLEDAGAWYTMTQFEATAARRAFPCFDEPQFKVPWQLTLRVPGDVTAVANTPMVSESDAGNAMKSLRFAPTEPLPSYLVAFAVGPWQIVDAGRAGMRPTPLRFIAPRGHGAALAFAARTLPEIFAQQERWFGIEYPFAKLDQIAIPLTVRFAMENAGLITYGAPILLQPVTAPAMFRHGVVGVAAHEMSHQWFGNLVTPAWWDDLWLNEAFATWFAEKTVDAWQPAYERGARRVEARAEAIDADLLRSARRIREPIVTRGDIYNAFDSITYQKGATVIGMFEGWLGDVPFQRGVRAYLGAHRYGSASAGDFLSALSSASGQPVTAAFSTFLDQNGVPRIGVKLECSARHARIALSQRRLVPFATDAGAQRWRVPVCVRYGTAASARQACRLMTDATAAIDLDGGCPKFVFANAGGRGYYVPDYQDDLLSRLKSRSRVLAPAELASLVYDLQPLWRAGAIDAAHVLDWIRTSARSRERSVTNATLTLASAVRDILASDVDRRNFSAFVRDVFGPRTRALGFAPRPGESDDDQLVRRRLLEFAAPYDPTLARKARRLAAAWLRDRKAIDPGLVVTVLQVAAQTGDAALFGAMAREAHVARDRLDRRNVLIALFSFGDRTLARRGLELLLDPALDIRETTTALSLARQSAPPSREPHDFIVAHFDALAARVDPDAPGGWPGYAGDLCGPLDHAEVEAFWRPRADRYPGAARNLAEALETIDACTALRARQAQGVSAFLARR